MFKISIIILTLLIHNNISVATECQENLTCQIESKTNNEYIENINKSTIEIENELLKQSLEKKNYREKTYAKPRRPDADKTDEKQINKIINNFKKQDERDKKYPYNFN
jgi:hypothetical protein